MNLDDLERTVSIFNKIPKDSWDEFFYSDEGSLIAEISRLARETLRSEGLVKGPPPKPVLDVLTMLGDGILSDSKVGPKIRAMVIRTLSAKQWAKLCAAYIDLCGKKSTPLHGNATQAGSGADIVAGYWWQGGVWASVFCEICRLPPSLASRRSNVLPDDEIIEAAKPLAPLHDFQCDVYNDMRKLLNGSTGHTAILSLPTGAGKTRVTVEALLDHLALLDHKSRRNAILWIAQSEELLRQAWECFRQVWQTAPQRNDKRTIHRHGLLTIRRAWGGGLKPSEMELDDGSTVLLAGIQQLEKWINEHSDTPLGSLWSTNRFAAVVVDEAHRLVTPSHRDILVELGLRKQNCWEPLSTSPPVIGLTATPWRTQEHQSDELARYFQNRLLKPSLLGNRPIHVLQQKKYLAQVKSMSLLSIDIPQMTQSQLVRYKQFGELPNDYLDTLGRHPQRNALIIRRLLKLPKKNSVLVFACSVEHAGILTLALNQAGRPARLVTGGTPRHERLAAIDAFRAKEIKFICNVGVLTTGFDAPEIDVVCITRPTASALLYEQMVGRGLRGPKNGGTESCLVLDVQDKTLPNEIMSYKRVLDLWDRI